MKRYCYQVRLTENEYAQLKKKAERQGVSRAVLLRKFIMGEPMVDKELREQLRSLTVEVSRIGNNINQLARKWNESGSDYRDIAPLCAYMGDVYAQIEEVREYCYSAHCKKRG